MKEVEIGKVTEIDDLARNITRRVQNVTVNEEMADSLYDKASKFHGTNVRALLKGVPKKKRRIETRIFKGPENFDELTKGVAFLGQWVRYTNAQKDIKYEGFVPQDSRTMSADFIAFLKKLKLKPEDYEFMLLDKYKKSFKSECMKAAIATRKRK